MTAKMSNNFINYSDFINIIIDAFNSAPRKLFEKMMQLIISSIHQQSIEVEKEALKIDEMNIIPIDDLEEYYDLMLDTIEDIKLLKKQLAKFKEKDSLFSTLYQSLEELHQAYVLHLDRMGQLEIRILAKEKSA